MILKNYTVYLFLFILAFSALLAQEKNGVKVGDIFPGDISIGGFELSERGEVTIKGRAVSYRGFEDNLIYYGWILNTETRELVWHLTDSDEFEKDGGAYTFKDEISLPEGTYEVYFTGNMYGYDDINGISDFFKRIFGKKRKHFKRRDREKLGMVVFGDSDIFKVIDGEDAIEKFTNGSIISFTRVGDSEDISKGFSLSDETDIRVYALGEGPSHSMVDYAYIYDLSKSRIVWKFDYDESDFAGGGKKNRVIDSEITLDKGSYELHYTTDDSHSYDDWNVLPPDDPQMYGVTIWPASPDDAKNVVPFKQIEKSIPIVEIVRVGDDEFSSKGFTLEKPIKVRVLGVGEGTSRHRLVDYGWIVNADTKEVVWDMRGSRNLIHAGGASKNKMLDEEIRLKKGNYIAYYTSDDSHSYDDWNSDPPFERNRWGITIWVVNENDKKFVDYFNPDRYRNKNLLTEIVRVRDDRKLSKHFSLNENSKIRIIAIGEGSRSGMADYGWIENERGQVVWEMTYRKTDHAGGAKKNRIFNDTIMLEAGEYKVYFETDGSHAFGDWNSEPPSNPQAYGITIIKE